MSNKYNSNFEKSILNDVKQLYSMMKYDEYSFETYSRIKESFLKMDYWRRNIILETLKSMKQNNRANESFYHTIGIILPVYAIIISLGNGVLPLLSKELQLANYYCIFNILLFVIIVLGGYLVYIQIKSCKEYSYSKLLPVLITINNEIANVHPCADAKDDILQQMLNKTIINEINS